MTVVERDPLSPVASVARAVAVYVPGALYACVTVAAPLMAPRFVDRPSPNSTTTFEMFAPVVGVTVKVIGTPALADDGEAVKLARARALTLTVTSALSTAPTRARIFAVV